MSKNWLIEDRNELFLYDSRNLHQLKISSSIKNTILKELLFEEEATPITEKIAYKMIKNKLVEGEHQVHPDDIHIEKIHGNLVNHVLQPDKWYMYIIGEKKAVLFPGNSSKSVIHSLASMEIFDSEWDWLLVLYAKYAIAAQKQSSSHSKTLLLDLESKYITRELTFLSEFNLNKEMKTSKLFHDQEIKHVDKLTALEELESKLIHSFVFYQNSLNQNPYKVTTSKNNEFYIGTDNLEQILQASYRNLEILLHNEIKEGTWVVVGDEAQLLRRVSSLLFQEHKINNSFFSIKKLDLKDKIIAMLERFEADFDQLILQVQKDNELNIYRMRCLKGKFIGTDWLYGYDVKEMMIKVLQQYFALHVQNSIELGEVNSLIDLEDDNYKITGPTTKNLREALKKNFQVNALYAPSLFSKNIYVLNLQRK